MGQVISKVVALFLAIGLSCSMLFVKKKHTALVCKDIEIAIQDDPEQSFITPKGIVDLLQSTHKIVLDKTPLEAINTYTIQQELKEHPLIKEVLVYKTWHGVLKIWLQSKYFIARVIRLSPKRAYTGEFVGDTERKNRSVLAVREDLSTGSTSKLPAEVAFSRKSIGLVEQNDAKLYVDGEGALIEIKELPLLRLLIITGKQITINKRKIEDQGLVALLHYIYKDAFWRKQITSLEVQEDGKIILGTQVGGHQIKFGYPDQIEDKFKKLALFYKHVIPYKGWNAYRMVNLAFKKQLICE